MSDLIVRVVQVDDVCPHPNADKLEIVKVGGWQIVSGLGNYRVGDSVVHVPPDSLVPKDLAIKWGVDQYLSYRVNSAKGRVKAVKLRGAASFGFLAPNETNSELGTNVAELLGIEKYEEPEPNDPGQLARNHPLFHTYTNIQSLRNFPKYLDLTQPVVVTEKLHGMNSRVGWIRSANEDGTPCFEKAIGSHRTQKKLEMAGTFGLPFDLYSKQLEKAKQLIIENLGTINSLIFFGEIYGPGVQDLQYGLKNKDWRIFDIALNGTYLPWIQLREICYQCDLPVVPSFAPYAYTFDQLCELAEGKSALAESQIKEGIVVRPMVETSWREGTLNPNAHRTIFKIISSDYLTRKGKTTEFH